MKASRIINFLYCIGEKDVADKLKTCLINEFLKNKDELDDAKETAYFWAAITKWNVWPGDHPVAKVAEAGRGSKRKADNDDYLSFYQKSMATKIVINPEDGTSYGGFSIDDVLRFTEAEMEDRHNYIQWVFPNPTLSRAQIDAADNILRLTEEQVDRITLEDNVMFRVKQMIVKILGFWGICLVSVDAVSTDAVFVSDPEKLCAKLSGKNHNQHRLTRLLIFLYCMHMQPLARKLTYLINEEIKTNKEFVPNAASLRIWNDLNLEKA